jgi:GT2 family glycosyltransferase
MASPPVTVVILNWNGRAWLERFLPSVLATSYPQVRILVVDNASTDDSLAFVQEHFPTVDVLPLDENYGFAEGNNRALPVIDTPYFVLLNSDVEVTPGWLSPLVERMEAHPKLAALQPKLLSWHQREHFEYAGAAGGFLDRFGYPFCRGRMFDAVEKDQGQYDQPVEVFWATGACLMIRTEVAREIGLFQPDFFAHWEEIDFCWRAHNLGYRIGCEPRGVVYHVGGGTLSTQNPRKTFLNVRNSLGALLLNLPARQLFPKILARLLLDGVWALKALTRNDWGTIGAIFRAHWAFFGKVPTWWRVRKRTYAALPPRTLPAAGYYPHSVVWRHFAAGIKRWDDLPGIEALPLPVAEESD